MFQTSGQLVRCFKINISSENFVGCQSWNRSHLETWQQKIWFPKNTEQKNKILIFGSLKKTFPSFFIFLLFVQIGKNAIAVLKADSYFQNLLLAKDCFKKPRAIARRPRLKFGFNQALHVLSCLLSIVHFANYRQEFLEPWAQLEGHRLEIGSKMTSSMEWPSNSFTKAIRGLGHGSKMK